MIKIKKKFFTLVLLLFSVFSVYAQEKDIPRNGEGIHAFLRRNNRTGIGDYEEFIKLNKGKFGKNNALLKGVNYLLPAVLQDVVSETDSNALANVETKVAASVKTNDQTTGRKQPLFGKKYENYTVKNRVLAGACFFLVSGHGGPDSGATAKVDGHDLHEDEYNYDIVLRLARNLLEHGATVHIIIQDKKDGIRDGKYLNNSKTETCMGKAIPLNQNKRLKQRCDAINNLSYKAKEKYQRAIFVHLDSRSKKQQLDVFFYHQDNAGNKKKSKRVADTMVKTFDEKYNEHQPGRGFSGTVTTRQLYVLNHTNPVSIFIELANMQNINDQRRYISDNNRQALANWLCLGFIKDYQQSK